MIKVERVLVTPELAGEWLLNNHNNRNFKWGQIAKYVTDMKAGHWREIGDPIRFEKANEAGVEYLLDGQNRLTALVQSGTSQYFYVVRGLDREAQVVMDSGSTRNVADSLKMKGFGLPARLAAAGRLIWNIEGGDARWNSREEISNTDLFEMINTNERLIKAVDAIDKIWLNVHVRPANAAVGYYFGSILEQGMTAKFFEKLKTGTELAPGDPILALRLRLNIEGGLTRNQQLWVLLRTMNTYRRGNQASRAQLPRGSRVGAFEIVKEVNDLVNNKVQSAYGPNFTWVGESVPAKTFVSGGPGNGYDSPYDEDGFARAGGGTK